MKMSSVGDSIRKWHNRRKWQNSIFPDRIMSSPDPKQQTQNEQIFYVLKDYLLLLDLIPKSRSK